MQKETDLGVSQTSLISLEGMMLKLKLQYFGHLMRRVDSLEKTLMLGGIRGRRRRGRRGWHGWRASLTRWTWVWVNSGSWWWTGRPGVLRFMGSQRVGHDWVTELNWTERSIYRTRPGSQTYLGKGKRERMDSCGKSIRHANDPQRPEESSSSYHYNCVMQQGHQPFMFLHSWKPLKKQCRRTSYNTLSLLHELVNICF